MPCAASAVSVTTTRNNVQEFVFEAFCIICYCFVGLARRHTSVLRRMQPYHDKPRAAVRDTRDNYGDTGRARAKYVYVHYYTRGMDLL